MRWARWFGVRAKYHALYGLAFAVQRQFHLDRDAAVTPIEDWRQIARFVIAIGLHPKRVTKNHLPIMLDKERALN